MGWLPDSACTETAGSLNPGDCLLIFTDGLIAALQHAAVDDRGVHELLCGRGDNSPADLATAIDAVLPLEPAQFRGRHLRGVHAIANYGR